MNFCFRKIVPERNMKRYYSITLTKTLFDEWCIVCIWGRLGGGGQSRQYTFKFEHEARFLLERLVKRRYTRQYHLA
ncbi:MULTISPECIES: WGR domain-containing protein [Brucella/Ochrobactrum group]|uniref:WGR domain-containing protein n=1 Tax=Brucella/Ochrobactrum group TaxID=2826938 RepID=UPI00211203C5|nr:WGR domain-containing protein [Brucella sp. NBRC 12950]